MLAYVHTGDLDSFWYIIEFIEIKSKTFIYIYSDAKINLIFFNLAVLVAFNSKRKVLGME